MYPSLIFGNSHREVYEPDSYSSVRSPRHGAKSSPAEKRSNAAGNRWTLASCKHCSCLDLVGRDGFDIYTST